MIIPFLSAIIPAAGHPDLIFAGAVYENGANKWLSRE
jgi:hypothetical protein